MNWREFRFDRKGKASLLWMVRQDGEFYHTKFGQVDGKMQETSDRPGPKGKEGTKAYVDAVANCQFAMERDIRKKTEGGYCEVIDGQMVTKQATSFSFSEHLPKNFTGPKPQTSITDTALAKLHKAKLARYTRKLDGFACVPVHHTWGWEIYSRRMDLMSDHFPNHIKELEKTKFKSGTILTGEMAVFKADGTDDFKALSRVCRSLKDDARKLVDTGEVKEPIFSIYDCLYKNGESLENHSYDDRSKVWKENFPELKLGQKELVCHVPYYQLTPDNWMKKAQEAGFEGWVVADGSKSFENKFISLSGKPDRMKGTWKLKPIWTEDVVIMAGSQGTGKRLNGIGAVFVKQIHPETGKFVELGKVGSGFSEEDLETLEKLFLKKGIPILEKDKDVQNLDLEDKNGIVMELEYSDRQISSNKFRFPVFCRIHLDKKVEECVMQRMAPEEDEE
jgi:ATP-dependent DNA ligase